MSVLKSSWSHGRQRFTPWLPDPSAHSDSGTGCVPEEHPEDTSAQDAEVSSLNLLSVDTNRAPNWPELRTLLQQLPPQDSDARYCLALGEEELTELQRFCAQRRREALGQGVTHLVPPKHKHTCEKCREQLWPGQLEVFTVRAGEQCCWHPACFTCQACGQTLVNLIYFYHDGRLYCGRHHAELLRPRCPACDQLIFSARCIEAEGRRWHENHFCCQDCAGPLGGGRYALPGGGPRCPRCFESRYSGAAWSPDRAAGEASLGEAQLIGVAYGDGAQGGCETSPARSSPQNLSLPVSSREQERPARSPAEGDAQEVPRDAQDTASCPTCSSSSDSEPEGFFLGQRLPQSWRCPQSSAAGHGDAPKGNCAVC